jgi:predicted O-methyltransferase YrrM
MQRRWAELTWFVRRPRLYRELLRRTGRKLSGRSRRQREVHRSPSALREALTWCEERAIDTSSAIGELTGHRPREQLPVLFGEELRTAYRAAERCPGKMGGPGNLDLIYRLAEHVQATRAIETAVAYGWSALAFLLSLQRRSGAQLVSTDLSYVRRRTDQCVGVAVPARFRSQWTLLRRPDREALPRALAILPEIDICHYDSDKSYDGRAWAYPRLWSALRPGGFFISDDIADNLAFRDFCRSVAREPVIVGTSGPPHLPTGDPTNRNERPQEIKYAGVLVKR